MRAPLSARRARLPRCPARRPPAPPARHRRRAHRSPRLAQRPRSLATPLLRSPEPMRDPSRLQRPCGDRLRARPSSVNVPVERSSSANASGSGRRARARRQGTCNSSSSAPTSSAWSQLLPAPEMSVPRAPRRAPRYASNEIVSRTHSHTARALTLGPKPAAAAAGLTSAASNEGASRSDQSAARAPTCSRGVGAGSA